MQTDEIDSYLHRATARVVAVSRDALEAADAGDQESIPPPQLQLARAILQSEGEYLALPSRFEVDAVLPRLADADERYREAARQWCAANHIEVELI